MRLYVSTSVTGITDKWLVLGIYDRLCRIFYVQLSVFRIYPNEGTHIIELWCNGNTAGFGPAVPGSNPGGSTGSNPYVVHLVRLRDHSINGSDRRYILRHSATE